MSGDLWRAYLDECGEGNVRPIANRTFLDYHNRLVSLNLVEAMKAAVPGKGREFSVPV